MGGWVVEYITVKEAAAKWGVSERRVCAFCAEGRVEGVIRKGRSYLIPKDAIRPIDNRSYRGVYIPKRYKTLFASIDKMKHETVSRNRLTRREIVKLLEDFLVEFTYNSVAMEGNSLTLEEISQVLQGVTLEDKPLKDQLETVGYGDAARYVMSLLSDNIPISEWVIREIHSLVMVDNYQHRGEYRSVNIASEYNHPKPDLVPVMMERLVASLDKGSRHPIEKAVLFYLEYSRIHPFIEGNGRTGFLLLNLMLMQAGYPPIIIKYADKEKHIDGLNQYFNNTDESPMVFLIGEYVRDILCQYLEILRE
jgi:Fic family protein